MKSLMPVNIDSDFRYARVCQSCDHVFCSTLHRSLLRGRDDHVHSVCDHDRHRTQLPPSQTRHV